MYQSLVNSVLILTIFLISLTVEASSIVKLPKPILHKISVEQAILKRRSFRSYKSSALSLQQVAQLLWAAQGITSNQGLRAVPSAGALYPLEIYLVVGNVTDLPEGVYHYIPQNHVLRLISKGDKREALKIAALKQSAVAEAPADIVITAIYQRTALKYGERAERYVHMEAGHAAQNIQLQAVSLGLGALTIGSFDDFEVINLLGLPQNNLPLYIIPIGKIL